MRTTMDIKRVLHIDDDKIIGKIVRLVLERMAGWKTDFASNCDEALVALETSKPDVILLDIMMPQIDGVETFARMKNLGLIANIPVIIITAKTLCTKGEEYLQMGAAGVIQKPFDPASLPDEIEEIVEKYISSRAAAAH